MKKLLALILVLVMVLSLAACSSNNDSKDDDEDNDDGGATVLPSVTSSAKAELVYEGDLPENIEAMFFNAVGYYDDSNTYYITNLKGERVNPNGYIDLHSESENYISVRNPATELYGLVDCRTGEEVVPCEFKQISDLSARFDIFYYETGLQYNGKIFDYELGRFIPNLVITTTDISANNGYIFFGDHNVDERTVYDANGNKVGDFYKVSYDSSGYSFLAEDTTTDSYTQRPDNFVIVDKEGAITRINGYMNSYRPVYANGEYLIHNFSDPNKDFSIAYQILDLKTNSVTQPTNYMISNVLSEKYVVVREYDDEAYKWYSGVIDAQGNVIIPIEYASIEYDFDRFVAQPYTDSDEKEYYLFDTTGKKLNAKPCNRQLGTMLYNADDVSGKTSVLFYNGTEVETEGAVYHDFGSVIFAGEKIYDRFSGKVLLENVGNCHMVNDKLYVYFGYGINKTSIYSIKEK